MTTRCLQTAIAMLTTLLAAGHLDAAEPVVRISTLPAPGESVIVGQRVRLILDVLDQDGWANVPKMPSLNIPGAIVYLPTGQATRLNETVSGEAYTGQRNEWWVYPQRSGPIRIPKIAVEIEIKTFDAKAKTDRKTLETEPVKMKAVFPEGVTGSTGFIATDRLQATQTWAPSYGELTVGDGIVRKIERTIGGAPALVLPVISFPVAEGVTVYPKASQSQESSNRGELTSVRIDQATYVFTEAGTANLPAIKCLWWNLDRGKLETETLPGQTILVKETGDTTVSPPNSKPEETEFFAAKTKLFWFSALLSMAAILVFLWVKRRRRATQTGLLNHDTHVQLPPLNP